MPRQIFTLKSWIPKQSISRRMSSSLDRRFSCKPLIPALASTPAFKLLQLQVRLSMGFGGVTDMLKTSSDPAQLKLDLGWCGSNHWEDSFLIYIYTLDDWHGTYIFKKINHPLRKGHDWFQASVIIFHVTHRGCIRPLTWPTYHIYPTTNSKW